MMSNKIKRIYSKALLLIGLLAITASCADELELKPLTTWGEDEYYKTDTEVEIAFAGMYATLKQSVDMLLMDAGTDESYAFKGWVEDHPTNVYTHNETSVDLTNAWRVLHIGINNANNMIARLNPDTFEDIEYNKYMGEAKFVRAFAYYQITTWWNEIPLRLEPTKDQSSNHIAASSVKEVYLQIIEDLTFAAEHLPSAFDADYVAGHANNMAAHALLARVYLKAGGYPLQASEINGKNPYQAAKEHCEIIMNQGGHSLVSSYRELFHNYIQNRVDLNESIWELMMKNGQSLGVSIGGRMGYDNGLLYKPNPRQGTPYADPLIQPSPLVELVYEDADERVEWNIPGIVGVKNNNNPNGRVNELAGAMSWGYCIGKFRRWDPIYPDDILAGNATDTPIVNIETPEPLHATQTGINLPIIRYADVLLMFAEATNEISGPTGEAVAAVDLIRARAGLENLGSAKPEAIAGQAAFFNEIVDERMRELCFEGNRKADLIRWGLLEQKLIEFEASILFHPGYIPENHGYKMRSSRNFDPSRHLSLPYPQQEVTINNLLDQKSNW